MPAPGEPAFETIARALAPFVGASMARAAIMVNLDKLGLHGPELSPADADLLLEALAPGLRVFMGEVQTRRVLDSIRQALATRGQDR
jgi:hypothetical protein